MDTATARAHLQRMVAWDQVPVLTNAEIDDLLLLARRTDPDGNAPLTPWLAGTVYTLNAVRIPTTNNGHSYVVTIAGTSGGSQPVWPTASGATVTDGSVTWKEAGLYLWVSTYDLRAAAAEGWRWKLAQVAGKFGFSADGASFHRDEVIDNCERMIRQYTRGVSSIRLVTSEH